MRGVGGIESKQWQKTTKPATCASSELIFKIKKKNPVTKLLGNIQEDKQKGLSQRSHQVCENARLIKQSFHKVSLWGLIFSSHSPKEVSDTVTNYMSLESASIQSTCSPEKPGHPQWPLELSPENLFLTHCQVSAKWASLWWHQILQCSHLPVLLLPPPCPPVQKHPYNFFFLFLSYLQYLVF